MSEIDVRKLQRELDAAGIESCGCNDAGVVWGPANQEIQDRPEVAAVLAAHQPGPTNAEIKAQLAAVVQNYLDGAARERGYEDAERCISYKGSSVPKWAAEGQAMLLGRDTVLLASYAIIDEVMAGQKPIPTAEELIAELPVIEW